MRGILYFSSTGNSLFVAQQLRERLGGQIRYLPAFDGSGEEFDEIIIVSPIYSFGLPVHVYDMIPDLTKIRPVWIVLTYGGMVAGADGLAYTHCKEHGVDIRGVYTVKMPENYTLDFSVPKFYEKATLKAAPKAIEKVASKIENGDVRIPKEKKSKKEIYLKNRLKWPLIVKDFSVSDDCIRCGKCVQICPSDIISIKDGAVTFADHCVICLGCYHRCPQKAIRYKNKNKTDRYLNPDIRESDIGKDL